MAKDKTQYITVGADFHRLDDLPWIEDLRQELNLKTKAELVRFAMFALKRSEAARSSFGAQLGRRAKPAGKLTSR